MQTPPSHPSPPPPNPPPPAGPPPPSPAGSFIADQFKTRFCCGFISDYPAAKVSRRCDKLLSSQQLALVAPPDLVTELVMASTLRKERKEVAAEVLSRVPAVAAGAEEVEDDVFHFKTPCCNVVWMGDACMAMLCEQCDRRFCQLCSRVMEEKGMTHAQAHAHVLQCTLQSFNMSFVFPYEFDDNVLAPATVHAVMKANYTRQYPLLHYGEERLVHPNLVPRGGDLLVDAYPTPSSPTSGP